MCDSGMMSYSGDHYLVASLAGEEWQRWKRTSLSPDVKAYLADMMVRVRCLFLPMTRKRIVCIAI